MYMCNCVSQIRNLLYLVDTAKIKDLKNKNKSNNFVNMGFYTSFNNLQIIELTFLILFYQFPTSKLN